MKQGDAIKTPRFLTVRIEEVFDRVKTAYDAGYYEPTHYQSDEYEILGKHTGHNLMRFAAAKKA